MAIDPLRPLLRVAAIAFATGALLVPRLWITAMLALALALGVLSFIPVGTRRVIVISMLGLASGSGAILLFATGLFQAPMIAEFGWTRTEYFLALQFSAPISIVASPLIGSLIDRYGVRRVVLVSIVALVLTLLAMASLVSGLASFYVLYAAIPLLGGGVAAVSFARLVANWFERRRGLALGAALAGMGMGGAVLTPFVQFVVGEASWRGGYVALAALLCVVVLPLCLLLLRDTPQELGRGVDGANVADAAPGARAVEPDPPRLVGFDARESRRQSAFRVLLAIFALLGLGIGGLLFQLVPVLTQRGLSAADAAAIAGSTGLALIAGRTLAGWLMDRYFAPRIALAFALGPILGAVLLAVTGEPWSAILAALCIGVAAGAEVDVIAYLVGRYFGTRAYGVNFGWQYAAWAAGAAMGPAIAAQAFDRLGSYAPALWIYAGLLATAALLLAFGLGPYPQLERSARTPEAQLALVDSPSARS